MNRKQEQQHAIMAWTYVRECLKADFSGSIKNFEFVKLLHDMSRAYPNELNEILMKEVLSEAS
jgi:hypothetical protein